MSMNAFDQMNEALKIAKQVQYAAERNANQMASMLSGHLRQVDSYTLVDLKRELSFFDSKRKRWRTPK